MRSKSLFSHLVYSEAVVRRIRKIYRKTSMPEFLFKQNKQETPTHYFLRTIPEDCSENWLFYYFFYIFLTVLYTHSRNIWNFLRKVYFSNNWALFAVNVEFLYHGAKAYYTDKSINRREQRLYWQSIHASVNSTKIRNFLRSSKSCVIWPRLSNVLGVSEN